MLLENPFSYLAFDDSTFSEPEFLTQITKRSGCGLLLDVNNVFISATNLGFDPQTYIHQLPLAHVARIHIGGHEQEACENSAMLLIDSHGSSAGSRRLGIRMRMSQDQKIFSMRSCHHAPQYPVGCTTVVVKLPIGNFQSIATMS